MTLRILIYVIAGLVISLAISLGVNRYQSSSYKKMKKDMDVQLIKAISVNEKFQEDLKVLKESVKVCEDGRLIDKDALATAITERDAAMSARIARQHKEDDRLAQALAGRCQAWATAPSCGIITLPEFEQ